jgi:hypothetical protein
MPKIARMKQNGNRNPYAIETPPVVDPLPKVDWDFLKSYDIFSQPISLMLDKKQRNQKHLKRYIQHFGTWFGVGLTFFISLISLVIFGLALHRKLIGVDDRFET